MIQSEIMQAILESLKDPMVFVDLNHVIRYMNKAACNHYKEGERLLGRSLLECHMKHP